MVLISSSLRALCRPQAVLSAPWDSKEPAVGVHCHLCKITCAPSVRCALSVVHHHLDAHHQHCLCTTGSNCAPLVVHHRHNTTAGPHAGAAVGWVDGTVVGWGALCCVGVTRGLFVVLCPSWCHTGALCCVVLVPHGGSLLCWCHTGALCCVVLVSHGGTLLCCVGVTRGLFVVLVSPVVTAVLCWCHTGSHSGVGAPPCPRGGFIGPLQVLVPPIKTYSRRRCFIPASPSVLLLAAPQLRSRRSRSRRRASTARWAPIRRRLWGWGGQ